MMKVKNSTVVGKLGEKHVGEFVKSQGLQVLTYNYFGSYDEIDIIALSKDYIVFIEVKTRRLGAKVSGLESITKAKCKRIVKCAQRFLMSKEGEKYKNMQPRFDVAEVTIRNSNLFEVVNLEYIENAFGG